MPQRATSKQRAEFYTSLQREYPNRNIDGVASKLLRLGSTSALYAERDCCDEYWCNEDPTRERKEESLERRILAACSELPGLIPDFSGDPRGHTLKLKTPSGYTDDWGQTGLCVPTS